LGVELLSSLHAELLSTEHCCQVYDYDWLCNSCTELLNICTKDILVVSSYYVIIDGKDNSMRS